MDIFEATLGTKIQVPTPYGAVNLSIPAATQEGQKFRLKGKGVPKVKGGGIGDLFVVVHVLIPDIKDEEDKKTLAKMMEKYIHPDRSSLLAKGVI